MAKLGICLIVLVVLLIGRVIPVELARPELLQFSKGAWGELQMFVTFCSFASLAAGIALGTAMQKLNAKSTDPHRFHS